uniref:Protein kinase domain-containing protein n=1 Tax=Rodentolepis nana TaxID=102285 RepID=A0A158QJC6_RODNA
LLVFQMIDHYHFRQDGLLCKLRKIVAAPDFIKTKQDSSSISSESLEDGSSNSFKKTATTINNLRFSTHSLPSLASFPLNSTTSDGNTGSGCSPAPRKNSEDVMHSSNDLISFNDWPNVTSLLANQNANNAPTSLKNITLGVGNKFNMQNNGAGLKRVSASAVNKFTRPSLPPLQSMTFGCVNDEFMHTPFTPVSTEATPTPKSGNLTSSPTSPFSRARLKPTFTSTSVGSVNINASSDGSQPRSISTSVTCPLIPDVFRVANSTNNSAPGQCSPNTSRAAQSNQISPCKFAPNNSLPPESLNFPPIIDVLWEEPDGSSEELLQISDRSHQSSSLVSINLEALPPPPPHILNPFIQRPPTTTTSQTSTSSVSSPQSCHHAPGVSTFCNSSCCQVKQQHPNNQPQQQQLRISPTQNQRKAEPAESVSENPEKFEIPVTRSQSIPASVLPAIEEAQKIYDSLPDNTLFLPSESIRLLDRLGGGNFGQVVKGIYHTPQGQDVEIAVKTLKESQIASTGEQTILSEAKTMTQLKHRHIVRLIGICKAQHFMLILELAPLGPINKYLKKHLIA